uniref:MFS transporter n=1 Tax=Fervidobacterium thailandense TaxID=1008305 RepID=A0A7C4GJR8_9BACT
MWMFDAAGVLVLSFTLPKISQEWSLTLQQSANVLSSTFAGMLVGALTVGVVSDLFGRKLSNLLYFLLTVLFTALLGTTKSVEHFIILRFLAGVGYGGLMPSVNAYLAEFMSRSMRGAYLVLLEASWALGSIAVGLVAVFTVESSWRISYYSFLLGLVLVPLILLLPESPRFAFKKYGKSGLEKILDVRISEDVEELPKTKFLVGDILRPPYLGRTISIWVCWFVVSFVYYTLFSWAPKIFAQKGLTDVKSLWFTFFMMVAQLPGYLSAAYFIEKIGRKHSLFVYFAGMATFSILWAFVSNTVQLVITALTLSFFTLGVWGLVYAYTPELYPTPLRATGNGMAGVVARIAGIFAPQFGGYMLSKGSNLLQIFLWLSIMSIVAGLVALRFGVETKNREIR